MKKYTKNFGEKTLDGRINLGEKIKLFRWKKNVIFFNISDN